MYSPPVAITLVPYYQKWGFILYYQDMTKESDLHQPFSFQCNAKTLPIWLLQLEDHSEVLIQESKPIKF